MKSARREISSSHFLINFLCVREEKEEEVDFAQLEEEKEEIWSKVMKILLKTFEKTYPDQFEDRTNIAGEAENLLQREFDMEVLVNIHRRNTTALEGDDEDTEDDDDDDDPEADKNTIVAVQFNDCPGTIVVYRQTCKQCFLKVLNNLSEKAPRPSSGINNLPLSHYVWQVVLLCQIYIVFYVSTWLPIFQIPPPTCVVHCTFHKALLSPSFVKKN